MVHLDFLCTCKKCIENNDRRKLYIADPIADNLQRSKVAVLTKGWDYVGIISGLPGVGKSNIIPTFS